MLRVLPGLRQFRGYHRGYLRGDIVAGLTVGAYLVPQVMAYATVAGLPPVAGLWAALGPLAVYVLLGTSTRLSVGPESTTALMTAVALAPLAAGDPRRYAAAASVLALIVGAVCLLAATVRLGVLADLLSRPVLVGYMAGIAGTMIVGQLGRVTGVPVTGESVPDQLRSFAANAGQWHPPTLALAAAVVGGLLLLARFAPRAPGPLLAVLLATGAVALFSLQRSGIAVAGSMPAGLPVPDPAAWGAVEIAPLLGPAIGIALVGFSDNALTARAFAAGRPERLSANRELAALGVTNLASGLLRGFPVSCSGSRTAIAVAAGARTQLYSVVVLAVVLAVLLGARDLLAAFPSAALGGLVIYAALSLIDVGEFRRIARFRRSEIVIASITVAAVLALGVLYGIAVAVGLSIFDLLRRVARAHDAVLGFVPGLPGMHDIDDYPQASTVPGLVVYRYDAPLCFANAENFRTRALATLTAEVRWFVLNAEANVEIDLTALDAMEALRAELHRRGIVFALARVKQDLRGDLDASGLTARIGAERMFPTLPSAVAAYRAETGAE